MPRYFAPKKTLKGSSFAYFILREDDTVLAVSHADKSEGASAYQPTWLLDQVAKGTWVEMSVPPLHTTDGGAAQMMLAASERLRGEEDYDTLIAYCELAARILHAQGFHATAEAMLK